MNNGSGKKKEKRHQLKPEDFQKRSRNIFREQGEEKSNE